jgi:hypothetical protein
MEASVDDSASNETEMKRAAVYGLEPTQLFDHPLDIPPYARMRLAAAERAPAALVRLVPKTIDDVKRWIGVPDELGAKRACGCKLPSAVPSAGSAADIAALPGSMRRALYELAYQYVYGDSRPVAAFKPVLNYFVDQSWINLFAIRQDINIYDHAVLTVGANIKVLYARNIYIWEGGLLKVTDDAKIDCVSIIGHHRGPVVFSPISVFGNLITVEEG